MRQKALNHLTLLNTCNVHLASIWLQDNKFGNAERDLNEGSQVGDGQRIVKNGDVGREVGEGDSEGCERGDVV